MISAAIVLLLLANFAVPAHVVLRYCVRRREVEISHILTFSFGFVFYWILPILIGQLGLYRGGPELRLWYEIFDSIPDMTIISFLARCLACYLAFWGGTALARFLFRPRDPQPVSGPFFYRNTLYPVLALASAASAILIFLLRNELFRGYADLSNFSAERLALWGSFASANLFLLSLALLYSVRREQTGGGATTFRGAVSHGFFAVYFIVSLLLLSMGGRLYFVSGLLALFVYRSVCFGRIPVRHVALGGVGLAAFVALMGLARMGSGVSPGALALNLVLEPLLTSFSLLAFLNAEHAVELLNAPIFLASNFINLIPSVLLPNKTELMVSPLDRGYVAFSPAGAMNSFISFAFNFGFLGTVLCIFIAAVWLGYLYSRRRQLVCRVAYVMVSAALAFTFFRDPFSISVVKTIVEYSLLIPAILVTVLSLVSRFLRLAALAARAARPSGSLGTAP